MAEIVCYRCPVSKLACSSPRRPRSISHAGRAAAPETLVQIVKSPRLEADSTGVMLLAAGLPVLVATAAVLVRAAVRRQDRGAWLALGFALAAEAAGTMVLAMPGGGPRFPTPADLALLAFFPAAFAAALLFARAR